MESYKMNNLGHIYLIDDDEAIRDALGLTLRDVGYEVFSFSCARDFLNAGSMQSPAVILLDMQMPDMTGLALQDTLRQQGKTTPIIFISGQSHPTQIVDVFRNGALNFIFKPFNDEELFKEVKYALEVDVKELDLTRKRLRVRNLYESLTPKEKEVCGLLVKGLLSKEIAWALNIASSTVKIHKSRVMEKMEVSSLQLLTAAYLDADLTSAV
jgi:FixJ family two-component response regulator